MPRLLTLLSILLLGAACAGTKVSKDGTTPPAPKEKGRSSAPPKPAKGQPDPGPVITPVSAFSGRVVLVNGPLKYLVAEGTIGRLPPVEQRLNIYRDGQKIGEAVVSNQSRGANFAADILQGEARVGDTLRSD